MLLVSVLSACGGQSLTTAEAVARAQKIQDYHDSSSFAFDFSKYTFTSADVDPNTGNMSSEIRSIKGVHYYSKTTVTMQLGSATSAATELTRSNIFIPKMAPITKPAMMVWAIRA
jgi:hypothetical protein